MEPAKRTAVPLGFICLLIYIFELLCQEFSSSDNAYAGSFGGVEELWVNFEEY